MAARRTKLLPQKPVIAHDSVTIYPFPGSATVSVALVGVPPASFATDNQTAAHYNHRGMPFTLAPIGGEGWGEGVVTVSMTLGITSPRSRLAQRECRPIFPLSLRSFAGREPERGAALSAFH